MKATSKIIVAIAATAAFTASAAYAGSTGGGNGTPSVQANASAMVISPVTITQTNGGLSFGTFSAQPGINGGGTITSGGAVTGGVNVIAPGTSGTFTATGANNTPYTIVGDSSVTLGDTNSDPTMMAALTYPTGSRTLNSTGTDNFSVSGVLTVGAGQPANTYSGFYNVAVHY